MKYISYRRGYKYQLAKTFTVTVKIFPFTVIDVGFISLTTDGFLTIREGYASDGPSGPTMDTPSSIRGAFVHDALYQLLRLGFLPQGFRKDCDQAAYELWTEDGMWVWRARLWRRELNNFGSPAADPKNIKRVYIAPRKGFLA